jgi:hypothetical protein
MTIKKIEKRMKKMKKTLDKRGKVCDYLSDSYMQKTGEGDSERGSFLFLEGSFFYFNRACI